MVAAGETVWLPPPELRAYVLPSLPAILTQEALAAVTVRVAESPALIEAGLAEMATVGCAAVTVPLREPHPTAHNAATERARAVQVLPQWRERKS